MQTPPAHDTDKNGILLILAAAILWGTTGTSQALAPAGVNPVALGTMRLLIGAFAMVAVAVMKSSFRGSGKWSAPTVALSAVFIASYQLTFFAAVSMTGVAVGTMIAIGSSPVAAGLLGFFVRGERLGLRWMAATTLAVIGCTLLAAGGGTISVNLSGVFLALLAGFSYAAYTVSIKGLLDRNRPDAVVAVVFSVAALLMAPLLLFYESGWVLSLRGAVVALHLGLFATAGAYWLFVRGLRTVKIGTAATLSLGEPLTAALLGVLLLGEKIGLLQSCGIALLFSGITILTAGAKNSEA